MCINHDLAAVAGQAATANTAATVLTDASPSVWASKCGKFTSTSCTAQVDTCNADTRCARVQGCLTKCDCGDTMCKIGCVRQAEGSPVVMEMMMCINNDLAAVAEQATTANTAATVLTDASP